MYKQELNQEIINTYRYSVECARHGSHLFFDGFFESKQKGVAKLMVKPQYWHFCTEKYVITILLLVDTSSSTFLLLFFNLD